MLSRSFVRIGEGYKAHYINTHQVVSVRWVEGLRGAWRVRLSGESDIEPTVIDLPDDEARPLLEALDRLTIL